MFKSQIYMNSGEIRLADFGDYSGRGYMEILVNGEWFRLELTSEDSKKLSEAHRALSRVLKILPPEPRPYPTSRRM